VTTALREPSSPLARAALERAAAEVAAWRSDAEAAQELEQIARAVARRTGGSASAALAPQLSALATAARIDTDVPTESRIRAAKGIKAGVKALVGFYVNHVAQQVRVLGEATVNLGRVTSKELGRLEGEVTVLREEVAELTRTVAELRGDAS